MPDLNARSPQLPDFSEKIRHEGTSKQAKYFVELGIPNVVVNNYDGKNLELVNLYAEQAMFPEFVIMTQQNRAGNNPVEMPYDRAFGPVTMTFLCDRQMTVKHFFDMWTQGVYSSFGGVLNYYEDYIVPEINIYKVDELHSKVYCVTLYNAYPKVVNDIVLAANSTDLARFQVTFTYELWKSFAIEGPGYDMATEIMGPPIDRRLPSSLPEIYGPPADLAGGGILGGITSSINKVTGEITKTIDNITTAVVGSIPDVPGIDFLNNSLGTSIPGSVGGIMKTMGISTGLDLINKMKNPRLMRDSLKRAARNVGSEILKGPKAQVLSKLPSSVRQIGGSVFGKIGGKFGL